MYFFPGKAEFVGGAGVQVFDEDVGFPQKFGKNFLAFGRFDVEPHGAFVAVELQIVKSVHAGEVGQFVAGRIAAAGTFDLDHFRAEPGQHLGTGRTGLNFCHVDDFYAF